MIFEKELKKLGLKDKEAAVYLSCLQLGPAPVQQISRKAGVVRATTYVVLESLENQGLVTHYKEGKKTLFSAEPPRQLMRLLERAKENIDQKHHDLELILPELQVLMKASGGRPSVRFFSGKEGLHAMRQEIVMYSNPGDTIYNFTPADHLNAVFPDNEDTHYPQRAGRGIIAKTIFTGKSESIKKLWLSREHSKKSERRFIPPDKFRFTSGMTIFRDRVAIGSFTGKPVGVIIESESMVEMMISLFNLAWEAADRFGIKNQK